MANPSSDITVEICTLIDQIQTACKSANGDFRKQANLILIECTTLAMPVLSLPGSGSTDYNVTPSGTLSPEQIK